MHRADSHATPWRRPTPLSFLGAALLALSVSLSGCGLLGGADDGAAQSASGLEMSTVRVGILPTIDTIPLQLALKNQHFAAEGLRVELVTVASGPAAVASLAGGDIQIALSSYVPFFVAQNSETVNLKIIAGCSVAVPNSIAVMIGPNSSVKNAAGLARAKVAVSARNTISDTLVMSSLKARGIDYRDVQWVEVPFPDMATRLAKGDVDAALMTEPFIARAKSQVGAVPLLDAVSGPTAGIAIAGYGATAEFVERNPKTVAAFQRAMRRAVVQAQDRAQAEPVLTEVARIDAATASRVALYGFRQEPEDVQLQRVSDLLVAFGVLTKRLDVSKMIATQAAP